MIRPFARLFGSLARLQPSERTLDLEWWDVELGIWLTLAIADIQEQAMAQGIPVLRGPYVVDYTDIPHDGDTKTLWTPQVGDVLLRVCADAQSFVPWDHGQPLLYNTDLRTDTFVRPDQSGWGTASDGHSWQAIPAPGTETINGDAGVLDGAVSLSLGAPLALSATDVDIQVRWQVRTGGATSDAVQIIFRATNDLSVSAQVLLTCAGSYELDVSGVDMATNRPAIGSWAGAGVGTWVWTRVQAQGATYRARSWLDGAPEPTTWDWTQDDDTILPGCAVALSAVLAGGHHLAVNRTRVSTLRPAWSGDAAGIPVVLGADPVRVCYSNTSSSDAAQGHIALWTLVARALAP